MSKRTAGIADWWLIGKLPNQNYRKRADSFFVVTVHVKKPFIVTKQSLSQTAQQSDEEPSCSFPGTTSEWGGGEGEHGVNMMCHDPQPCEFRDTQAKGVGVKINFRIGAK